MPGQSAATLPVVLCLRLDPCAPPVSTSANKLGICCFPFQVFNRGSRAHVSPLFARLSCAPLPRGRPGMVFRDLVEGTRAWLHDVPRGCIELRCLLRRSPTSSSRPPPMLALNGGEPSSSAAPLSCIHV